MLPCLFFRAQDAQEISGRFERCFWTNLHSCGNNTRSALATSSLWITYQDLACRRLDAPHFPKTQCLQFDPDSVLSRSLLCASGPDPSSAFKGLPAQLTCAVCLCLKEDVPLLPRGSQACRSLQQIMHDFNDMFAEAAPSWLRGTNMQPNHAMDWMSWCGMRSDLCMSI